MASQKFPFRVTSLKGLYKLADAFTRCTENVICEIEYMPGHLVLLTVNIQHVGGCCRSRGDRSERTA